MFANIMIWLIVEVFVLFVALEEEYKKGCVHTFAGVSAFLIAQKNGGS